MMAYHFVNATLRDGRPVPPDGEWLEHDGAVVMCESGLHASLTPWQALAGLCKHPQRIGHPETNASWAYRHDDAMLIERAKERQ